MGLLALHYNATHRIAVFIKQTTYCTIDQQKHTVYRCKIHYVALHYWGSWRSFCSLSIHGTLYSESNSYWDYLSTCPRTRIVWWQDAIEMRYGVYTMNTNHTFPQSSNTLWWNLIFLAASLALPLFPRCSQFHVLRYNTVLQQSLIHTHGYNTQK